MNYRDLIVVGAVWAVAGAAVAQDSDATFRNRVFRDDRASAGVAETVDFKSAGYVRLEIDAPNASDAGYCTARESRGWGREFRSMIDLLTGREWTSGTAVRVWHGSSANAPTPENATMDINVLRVTRRNSSDCQSDDDHGPFLSTLVRTDSTGFAVQTRRWYIARNDPARMAYVDNALGWASKMVGVPAAIGDELTREGSRLITLRTTENLGSTSRLRFDPQNTDSKNGGSSVVRVFIGYQTPNGGLSMGSVREPHISMRLRPVASLWAQAVTTYENLDLNDKASGDLMREPIGSTTLGSIIDANQQMKDLLTRINRTTTIGDFDDECRALRLRLIQDAGFSDTDASVVLYSIGMKHPFLGRDAPGGTVGYLASDCLRERTDELKNAGIEYNVVEPVTPVDAAAVAAASAGIAAIARADSPQEVALITAGLFAEEVVVADLTQGRLLGLGNQERHQRADVAAAVVRAFDGAGCLSPSTATTAAFMAWPAYLGGQAGGRTAFTLLSQAETDEAVGALLMFDPAPAGQQPKVGAIFLTSDVTEVAAVVQQAYPAGCGAWKPSNIYPPAAEPIRSPTEVPYQPS